MILSVRGDALTGVGDRTFLILIEPFNRTDGSEHEE
jgi:hypothetical protein